MDTVENHLQLETVISDVETPGSVTRQLQQLAINVYVTVQAVKFTLPSLFTAVIRNSSMFRVTSGLDFNWFPLRQFKYILYIIYTSVRQYTGPICGNLVPICETLQSRKPEDLIRDIHRYQPVESSPVHSLPS